MTVVEKREAKIKRISDAIALREPDRVPLSPSVSTFPYTQNGHTVAQCVYDLTQAEHAVLQYLDTYDPDAVNGFANANIGMGQILEKAKPKNFHWAGEPGSTISENSIHQFIEYTLLQDDEFEEFATDLTGWIIKKGLPRVSGMAECFAGLDLAPGALYTPYFPLAGFFGHPATREMMKTLWEISDLMAERNAGLAAINKKIYEKGYPLLAGGMAMVPFDAYSDFLRGTMDGMMDLYTRPEDIKTFCDLQMEKELASIRKMGEMNKGQNKHLFMALHKGFDSFMGAEHYQEFYWSYLQRMICEIIDAGMVPYIFCEGSYSSRLAFLKDVPKGKVLYRFEKVDLEAAKRELGDVACISGAFPGYLLDYGTKEQVVDEVKRIIDICAPGGGYIFDVDCGLSEAKPENVEAMMDTVKTYGKK